MKVQNEQDSASEKEPDLFDQVNEKMNSKTGNKKGSIEQ